MAASTTIPKQSNSACEKPRIAFAGNTDCPSLRGLTKRLPVLFGWIRKTASLPATMSTVPMYGRRWTSAAHPTILTIIIFFSDPIVNIALWIISCATPASLSPIAQQHYPSAHWFGKSSGKMDQCKAPSALGGNLQQGHSYRLAPGRSFAFGGTGLIQTADNVAHITRSWTR